MNPKQATKGMQVGAATTDVLTSTQPRHTLAPKIWTPQHTLEDKVSHVLIKLAVAFVESWDLPTEVPVEDIILTGSTAGFNWTKDSDIDLHIVVDPSTLHDQSGALMKYLNAKAALWNAKHAINIFGHPVELYVQDSQEPHTAPGIYSLVRHQWVQPPAAVQGDVDKEQIAQLVEKYLDGIKYLQVLQQKKQYDKVHAKATALRNHIKKKRQEGLRIQGLQSPHNLAFKVLRRSGALQRLSDLQTSAYDASLTLKEKAPCSTCDLDSILEALTQQYHSTPQGSRKQLGEAVLKAITEHQAEQVVSLHLTAGSLLPSTTLSKAVLHDLKAHGALADYARAITEQGLISYTELAAQGDLFEQFTMHYMDRYPSLVQPALLQELLNLTSHESAARGVGKGEALLALYCKDVSRSPAGKGDLKVGQDLFVEVKGVAARASVSGAWHDRDHKVLVQKVADKLGADVPNVRGRFPAILGSMYEQVCKGPDLDGRRAAFADSLREALSEVYGKALMFVTEEWDNIRKDSFKKTYCKTKFDEQRFEKDLATILVEYHAHVHGFHQVLFLNTDSGRASYLITPVAQLRKALQESVSVVLRDASPRLTYKPKLDESTAYHASFKSSPDALTYSEALPDAAIAARFVSETGFLGTGLYVFGDKEAADEYAKFMEQRVDRNGARVYPIGLTGLKLYRPSNPEEFVHDLRATTINLYHLEGDELAEEIAQAAQELSKYSSLTPDQLTQVLEQFAAELKAPVPAKDAVQLSNRILKGYDGIDLIGTSKDHFGTGSVIFPNAIKKIKTQLTK